MLWGVCYRESAAWLLSRQFGPHSRAGIMWGRLCPGLPCVALNPTKSVYPGSSSYAIYAKGRRVGEWCMKYTKHIIMQAPCNDKCQMFLFRAHS